MPAFISIHALLAESDRPPRVATLFGGVISIHALLAESDTTTFLWNPVKWYFYPRSPCGERRVEAGFTRKPANFYPRSPCGERPRKNLDDDFASVIISIHALLAESDYNTRSDIVKAVISIHALLAESDSKSAQNSGVLLRI